MKEGKRRESRKSLGSLKKLEKKKDENGDDPRERTYTDELQNIADKAQAQFKKSVALATCKFVKPDSPGISRESTKVDISDLESSMDEIFGSFKQLVVDNQNRLQDTLAEMLAQDIRDV